MVYNLPRLGLRLSILYAMHTLYQLKCLRARRLNDEVPAYPVRLRRSLLVRKNAIHNSTINLGTTSISIAQIILGLLVRLYNGWTTISGIYSGPISLRWRVRQPLIRELG